MNKYQQALDDIKYPVMGNQADYQQPYIDEAYVILQDLVDKAIPKKPERFQVKYTGYFRSDNDKEKDKVDTYYCCADCECVMCVKRGDEIIKGEQYFYCPNCGQKLDWSNE